LTKFGVDFTQLEYTPAPYIFILRSKITIWQESELETKATQAANKFLTLKLYVYGNRSYKM